MKKKILKMIIITVTLAVFLPAVAYSAGETEVKTGTCGENAVYSFYPETGVLSINGSGFISGELPWNTEGYSDQIKSIIIGKDITSVYHLIKHDIPNLTSYTVEEGNTYYVSKNGVLFLEWAKQQGSYLIAYPAAKEDVSYSIPEGTTHVGQYIDYADSATYRAVDSFGGNRYMTELVFPDSMASFAGSLPTSLKSVSVSSENDEFRAIGGVLFHTEGSDSCLYRMPPAYEAADGIYIIPAGTRQVHPGSLKKAPTISTVVVPSSVIKIGNGALHDGITLKMKCTDSGHAAALSPYTVELIHNMKGYECEDCDYAISNVGEPAALRAFIAPNTSDTQVNLVVSLDVNPGMSNVAFAVKYDEEAFELVEVTDYRLFGDPAGFSETLKSNPYYCSWFAEGGDREDSTGEMVSLTYKKIGVQPGVEYQFEIVREEGAYSVFENGILVPKSVPFSVSGCTYSEAGVDVKGIVRSYNPSSPVKVQLLQNDLEKYSVIIPPSGDTGQQNQDFLIENVMPGNYDLKVTKKAHLPYVIKGITVENSDLDLTTSDISTISVITMLAGDVNEDLAINGSDLNFVWNRANYNKSIAMEGVNAMADINGDGKVNGSDLNIIWNRSHYNKGLVDCIVEYPFE